MGIDIMLIIGILLVIAACVLLFKLLESVSQAVLMFNIALFVILLMGGVFLFADFKAFTDSFPQKEKIVLIENNSDIASAALLKGNTPEILNPAPYAQAYQKKSFAGLIGKNQTIIVLKQAMIDKANGNYGDLQEMFSDTRMMIAEYKMGNAMIYPEPVSFKLIRFIPDQILQVKQEKK